MTDVTFAFRVDADAEAWALYRQTRTQQRVVAARTGERVFWVGQDREDRAETVGLEPVSDEFLDAVAATFLRGPAGRDWELQPIFDALAWYEAECIEDLRAVRNETQHARMHSDTRERMREKGHDVPESPRAMPSEAWDLVKQARSQFKLTESWAYKPGDTSTKGRPDGEKHPDEASLTYYGGDDGGD